MSIDPQSLHSISKSLEYPDIPARLQLVDGRVFSFSIVRSEEQEELMSQLSPRREGESWAIEEWASWAMLYPGFVVSIRREGEERSSGFLAFDTRVYTFEREKGLTISVTIEPQVVYISPDARGQGFGRAFVSLLASEIKHTLTLIEDAMQNRLKGARVEDVSLALVAECVSEEGARFVRRALVECRSALSEFRSARPGDKRWCEDVEDRVDYSDWSEDEELGAVPCL